MYYRPFEQRSPPLVIWPERSGTYSVIQVWQIERPLVRFGERRASHEELSKLCARELRIQDGTIVPTGAGFAEIRLEDRIASFYGRSREYDIGINTKHLEELQQRIPEWTIGY